MRYSAQPARSVFYLSRFSVLGGLSNRRPRSAKGPGQTARWGLRHAWSPKRLKKVTIPPF